MQFLFYGPRRNLSPQISIIFSPITLPPTLKQQSQNNTVSYKKTSSHLPLTFLFLELSLHISAASASYSYRPLLELRARATSHLHWLPGLHLLFSKEAISKMSPGQRILTSSITRKLVGFIIRVSVTLRFYFILAMRGNKYFLQFSSQMHNAFYVCTFFHSYS